MSRKRIKQYLMLLTVAGLVAVAANGSGTFASFNAEVTNPGNTFATGTLFLHETNGTTTCASESVATNNNGNCVTLFDNVPLSVGDMTLTADAAAGAVTSLTVSAIEGAAVEPGDTLTVSDGTHSFVFTASAEAAVGATSITGTGTADVTYHANAATVSRDTITSFAKLTLTNAGTIDANGISFDVPSGCTVTTKGGSTTLTSNLSSGAQTTIGVTSIPYAIQAGDLITITDGTNTETVTAANPATTSDTSIDVTGSSLVHSYSTSNTTVKWGANFNGPTTCNILRWGIIQTDSSATPVKCVWGNTSGSTCDVSTASAYNLSANAPTTLTSLPLIAGDSTGNTGSELDAGKSRYLTIAVQTDNPTNTNTNQGTTASFSLSWNIAQK